MDKGLLFRIYKVLNKLNSRRTNNLVNKWANKLNRQFSNETQMANEYMKKCSTSLVIKEMQIKIILRFYLNPVMIAVIMKMINKYW
jgi:hypothetical protein